MPAPVSLFGIRHHGPGSARRLVEALDALAPATVLIEGPADATPLLPMLADPAMVPPVALLTYPEDAPAEANFFPFAEFSPEYQAARWALARGAELRFIDLPAADRPSANRSAADADADADADSDAESNAGAEAGAPADEPLDPISRDPIGALAAAAGYDDGESWWSDVIEENPASHAVFAAVADAMAALRQHAAPPGPQEAAREAHMRLEIARAARESAGPIAVVCGAWHVPALAVPQSQSADRALLKGRPKSRVKITWAPWTAPRLARASGYGAGVVAPGWCAHLWATRDDADGATLWLARIAGALRAQDHFVSTASVIEARRLGHALAALRNRPHPGFAELREAAIACLCNGAASQWETIADALLIGADVGAVPANTPLAPLLDDLQRQQKATKLKPEALERALTLDLRSDSGLARSTLLHRLNALDVPWGRLTDAGRSRGTFRENWVLVWESEFAVRLVEQLVYGATIAEAAAGRLSEAMAGAADLGALATLVRSAMIADLPQATASGIALLERRAALTSDCQALLAALPPMADILRYGEARAGTAPQLAALMPRITFQAALALPYAARNLSAEAAAALRAALLAADRAIQLAELDAATVAHWHAALSQLIADGQATRLVAGVAARLLYEAGLLSTDAAAALLARMLSPGTPVSEAAGFFEGFLEGMGARLIHDDPLRIAVDAWLIGLDEEAFVASLPLFRRVFTGLDPAERRRLIDAALGRGTARAGGYRLVPGAEALWPAHAARIAALMTGASR